MQKESGMQPYWTKRLYYLPITLILIYNLFTLLLTKIGPLKWNFQHEGLFWMYMLLYNAACLGGYIFAIKKAPRYLPCFTHTVVTDKSIIKFTWIYLCVCFILSFIRYKNVTGAQSLLPLSLPEETIKGFINPGRQYVEYQQTAHTGNKALTFLYGLGAAAAWSLIPYFVMRWERTTKAQKAVFYYLVLFEMSCYASIGTNKGIVDTAILLVFSLFIYFCKNWMQATCTHLAKARKAIIIFGFCMVLVAGFFFVRTMETRMEIHHGQKEEEGNTAVDYSIQEGLQKRGIIKTAPAALSENACPIQKTLHTAYLTGALYLTNGYYGFSVALDEPFTSTFGIGHSGFLLNNFKQVLDVDLWPRTYQMKIDHEWSRTGKWHTFYLWVANDVHFVGVIIVMFLLGAICALTWYEAIRNDNIFSQCLLTLFIILFMYIPVNNQVFSQLMTMASFYELALLWLVSRIHNGRNSNTASAE